MTAHSLDDYLSTVRHIRDEWGIPDHQELWFRAEDELHLQTRLQPGLYRPRNDGGRRSIDELLDLENDLYEEFIRCGSQLSDIRLNDDDWGPYFLMQHHGVPTRILDWSDSALIALHFAVAKKSIPFVMGSVIYVLDPLWLTDLLDNQPDQKDAERRWKKYSRKHPYDSSEEDCDRLYLPASKDDADEPLLATPKTPILWDSPHISRRVAAQRSRFMIFGTDPLWISKMAEQKNSRFLSIHIAAKSITEIKRSLRDAGITESVVYPDLDGLGRELRQMWELRR